MDKFLVILEKGEHGEYILLDVGKLYERFNYMSFQTNAVCLKHRHHIKILQINTPEEKLMFADETRIKPILYRFLDIADSLNDTLMHNSINKLLTHILDTQCEIFDIKDYNFVSDEPTLM